MDVPLAQTADLTCPQCGQAFTAEIWLIVDGSSHYLDYVEAANESKRRRLRRWDTAWWSFGGRISPGARGAGGAGEVRR